MKPDQTRRNAQRLVSEREETKQPLTIDFPLWSTPNQKPGDALLTRWYGGIAIRELPPSIDEMLDLMKG